MTWLSGPSVTPIRSADKDPAAQAAIDLAEASWAAGFAVARGYDDEAAAWNKRALLALGRLFSARRLRR